MGGQRSCFRGASSGYFQTSAVSSELGEPSSELSALRRLLGKAAELLAPLNASRSSNAREGLVVAKETNRCFHCEVIDLVNNSSYDFDDVMEGLSKAAGEILAEQPAALSIANFMLFGVAVQAFEQVFRARAAGPGLSEEALRRAEPAGRG